ncbi:monosaccharide-sensing protein 3 isoform X2 [Cajanus cajan]|uniref:monosaccharide-sensing protein 3 isoform X2 n=1 Tax=Cajanus cajan TaxID=3821 RepID=UPI00098DB062|nr:monosaccharide-sensing protein 3 isoform X2 [Cajanus cajan]
MREVVIIAVAATLGNLLVGWDSSTIAGGMSYIKQEFKLDSDPTLEGLIVSTPFITGTVVTIFSGTVSDILGRRPMLIASSVMFFLSGLVMLWAPNVSAVLCSRLLDGVAIALAITLTPLYISEIAPPDIRGTLNTLPQFSCSAGMFVAYVMVFCMSLTDAPSWRAMLGVVSVPSVAYFSLAMFYLPESPPWLVSKGRIPQARKVLQRIRGTEDVSGELALLSEGMSPGGEGTTIEEYMVAPASDLMATKEAGRDCIKLYGPNQGGVSMVAQPLSGQGSMLSRSMLTLSRQGSLVAQAQNLKDPLVSLFGSLHESVNPLELGASRSTLMIEPDQSPFGTSDNLHAPLLSAQVSIDKALGEIPKNTDIGGGWKLVYKTSEGGKNDGKLQRVYLRADTNAASQHGSFVTGSGYDLHVDGVGAGGAGGESFQAAALVSHSVLIPKDVNIKQEVASAKRKGLGDLFDTGVKRALTVGIGLQLLQQFAGINGFLYYAPQILEQAGVGDLLSHLGFTPTSASLLVNVVTTFTMLPCIAISMRLMDVAGRRSILLYTIPILIVSLMILVVRNSIPMSSTLNAIITAASVMVYESCFCMGLGVIPNILCSEIFPTSVRGICISICSLTFWICILIVTSTFPFLIQLLGLTGVFGLYVVGCILAWIFVYLKVPETKGMPLEVIIEFFSIGSKPE